MQHYRSGAPTEGFLTLSFNRQYIRHPERYFVAAGETLAAIEQFIADAKDLQPAYDALAKETGMDFYDGHHFAINGWTIEDLQKVEGQPHFFHPNRPDFITPDIRLWEFFPNTDTEGGRGIQEKCLALKLRADPDARFAAWLGAIDDNTNPDGEARFKDHPLWPNDRKSASVRQIADQWIVAVPVTGEAVYGPAGRKGGAIAYQERWTIPPESTPLAVSDYFRLLEAGQLLFNTPKP